MKNVPCKQRFLSGMAFRVNEVIRVACQSHSWFVLYTLGGVNKLTTRQTSHTNDFVNAKSHARKKSLLARYEKWKPTLVCLYLAGFLKTLLQNGIFRQTGFFFQPKTVSKVATIQAKSVTIAF